MTKYSKGRRKEYYIVEKLKESGKYDIVQRTAGSHSVIDIFAIDITNKEIVLIQCKRTMKEKMNYIDDIKKKRIEERNKDLNGLFNIKFKAM